MARCYICDATDGEGSTNPIRVDEKTGKEMCQICFDIAFDAVLEYDMAVTSDQFKNEHGVKPGGGEVKTKKGN